eukprot:1146495-Pelagomonas_calceolata.AAC.2
MIHFSMGKPFRKGKGKGERVFVAMKVLINLLNRQQVQLFVHKHDRCTEEPDLGGECISEPQVVEDIAVPDAIKQDYP